MIHDYFEEEKNKSLLFWRKPRKNDKCNYNINAASNKINHNLNMMNL